jgi:hypothetical protein
MAKRCKLSWRGSALGPRRNGRARASAVSNGHVRSRGIAGRQPSSSSSWDDACGRFGLWSRRSEAEPSVPKLLPPCVGPTCGRLCRRSSAAHTPVTPGHRKVTGASGPPMSQQLASLDAQPQYPRLCRERTRCQGTGRPQKDIYDCATTARS